jgi:hypothetical protein
VPPTVAADTPTAAAPTVVPTPPASTPTAARTTPTASRGWLGCQVDPAAGAVPLFSLALPLLVAVGVRRLDRLRR